MLLSLLRVYSSPEMSRALRTLRRWRDEHGDQFVADWAAAMPTGGDPEAREVDRARRWVTSYFQDVDALRRARLISKHTMGVAVDKAGVGVLVHVCAPLERALNPRVNLRFIARVIALVPAHRRELMPSVPIGGIGDEPEP